MDMLDTYIFNNWITLTFLYAFFVGIKRIVNKKAVEKSDVFGVLAFYSFVSLILVLPYINIASTITFEQFLFLLLKSSLIYLSWVISFYIIKKVDVGVIGILESERLVFSIILSIIFLNEKFSWMVTIGAAIVVLGISLIKIREKKGKFELKGKYLILLTLGNFFNSISGIIDKKITVDLDPRSLQFWFVLLTCIFNIITFVVYKVYKKQDFNLINLIKNKYIYLLSIFFVFGDILLFFACAIPISQNQVMSVIKISSIIFTILLGQIFLKERDTLYKLMCSLIVIIGVIFTIL